MKRKRLDNHEQRKRLKGQGSSSWLIPCVQSRSRPNASVDQEEDTDVTKQLPEDLLLAILSRLSLREIARTSVLSPHFTSATRSLTTLIFDIHSMLEVLPNDAEQNQRSTHCCCDDYRRQFVDGVTQFLKFHRAPKVHDVVLDFCFRPDGYKEEIDSWIRSSIGKGVESLELYLSCTSSPQCIDIAWWKYMKHDRYVLTADVFGGRSSTSTLQRLGLGYCTLAQDLSSVHFSALVALRFLYIPLGQYDLQSFLCCMPKLKELYIAKCITPSKLSLGCLPCLETLRVLHCLNMREVEFCNNQALTVFHMVNYQAIKCNISEAPNLTFMGLNPDKRAMRYTLTRLSRDFPNLKSLYIYYHSDWVNCFPEVIGNFSQLTSLCLNLIWRTKFRLSKLVALLQALPVLNEFYLTTTCDEHVEEEPAERSEFVHRYLKIAKIWGHLSTQDEIKFITYVVNHAPTLELLTIIKCSVDRYLNHHRRCWCEGEREELSLKIKGLLEVGICGNNSRKVEVRLLPLEPTIGSS